MHAGCVQVRWTRLRLSRRRPRSPITDGPSRVANLQAQRAHRLRGRQLLPLLSWNAQLDRAPTELPSIYSCREIHNRIVRNKAGEVEVLHRATIHAISPKWARGAAVNLMRA